MSDDELVSAIGVPPRPKPRLYRIGGDPAPWETYLLPTGIVAAAVVLFLLGVLIGVHL